MASSKDAHLMGRCSMREDISRRDPSEAGLDDGEDEAGGERVTSCVKSSSSELLE